MQVKETEIRGLYTIALDVHQDERGNFREVWQIEKLIDLGLTSITPVQLNVAESVRGVTRGIHAEPWQKYLHVAYGYVFAAIVDIREDSDTFAKVLTFEMNNSNALLIPLGCANSYQILSENAAYSYLVTDHWKPNQKYMAISLNDQDLNIPWPIGKEQQIISTKDAKNPQIRNLFPNKYH